MVPTPTIADHVAEKGGPPEYVAKNGPRLVEVAEALVTIAEEQAAAKKK
jgi:hypothetical protein